MTVFGDRAYKEVIKVKKESYGWGPDTSSVLVRRDMQSLTPTSTTRGYREKAADHKAERGPSLESESTRTLVLDLPIFRIVRK